MKKYMFYLLIIVSFLILISACSSNTGSQTNENTYPEKDIQIYVPVDPGGQTDSSIRLIAKMLEDELETSITIVNQTGGGGSTALNTVANADPDGHTLFYDHQGTLMRMALGQSGLDPLEDFTPITTMTSTNQTMIANSDSGWDDIGDFFEDAKENPGKYSYGTNFGGGSFFMGAMMEQRTDVDLEFLEYTAESDRMPALMSGQIDIGASGIENAQGYQESGDLKILGVLTEERDENLPDVPTAKELGYDIVFPFTHVLYGPADLNEEIIKKWNNIVNELVEDEDYQKSIGDIYQNHDFKDYEETKRFVEEEINTINDLIDNLPEDIQKGL